MRASEKTAFEKYSAKKIRSLQQSRRSYQYAADQWHGMLQYDSVGGDFSLNCKFVDRDNNLIACRHLAFEFLKRHKRYSASSYSYAFSSQRAVSQTALAKNEFDKTRIDMSGDAYYVMPIHENGFGRGLYAACKSMRVGECRLFSFSSWNHMMAVVVDYKAPGVLSVKFYDPNETLRHNRIVCRNLASLQSLQLSGVLSDKEIALYFSCDEDAVLVQYNNPFKVTRDDKTAPMFWVAGASPSNDFAMYAAMFYDSVAGVRLSMRALVEDFQRGLMSHEGLVRKLKKTGLYKGTLASLARSKSNMQAFIVYLYDVLNTRLDVLSDKDKLNIFNAVGNDEASSTLLGLALGQSVTFMMAYIYIVLLIDARRLSMTAKTLLLSSCGVGEDLSHCSILNWLASRDQEMFTGYLQLILATPTEQLSSAAKMRLLSSNVQGDNFIYTMLQLNDASSMKFYLQLILQTAAPGLTLADKRLLLQPVCSGEYQTVASCMIDGNDETILTYVETFLYSSAAGFDLRAIISPDLLELCVANGRIKLLHELTRLYLSAYGDNMISAAQLQGLLCGDNAGSIPVILSAYMQANEELLSALLRTILDQPNDVLLGCQKVDILLVGLSVDGGQPIYTLSALEKPTSLRTYLRSVVETDAKYLSNDQKMELFGLPQLKQMPAFERALYASWMQQLTAVIVECAAPSFRSPCLSELQQLSLQAIRETRPRLFRSIVCKDLFDTAADSASVPARKRSIML